MTATTPPSVEALIDELISVGIELTPNGDKLKLHAPRKGMLTAELKAHLSERKPEILAELRRRRQDVTQPEVVMQVALPGAPPEPGIARQLARWRAIFGRPVQRPLQLHRLDIKRLEQAALAFLDSHHAATALRLGWDELELFGAYDWAPHTRADVRCLVAEWAWGPGGRELIGIDEREALFRSPQGGTQAHPRRPTGFHYAKPIWEILRME